MADFDSLPLLTHPQRESVVAYRHGLPITAGKLMADAAALRAALPPVNHVLNICSDRYLFLVGFVAGVTAGKTSLLSPSLVPEVIKHLRAFAPDTVCLAETDTADIGLPMLRIAWDPAAHAPPALAEWRIPHIPCAQEVACVFTSGSTGTPVPHRKTWGNLARNVRVEAGRLQLHDGRSHCVVATVPVQHMYGFETSLLMPLQSGQAFAAERPFFPADIASTLAAVPRPRMLTSTPLHLNALLGAGIELPAVDLIVCATALLDAANARDIESRFGAPLMEIYGSTETGQIASRRTTATSEWQLWPGVRLETKEDRTWAAGGTIAEPTLLGDVVQSIDADRFYLHGRTEDLVNIAGKRSSLAYLSHQLNSIPGVTDGAFFLPIEGGERAGLRTTRLGAIAVAPRLTPDSILRELRLRIDPVFLPRPLRLVDRIPRNTTGKLRRADLDALVARGGAAKTQVDLHIAADHPAFEGHFPGLPLVPGAVLLDEIVRTIVAAHGLSSRQCTIPSAKFKRIVRPGDALTLAFEFTGPAAIHFELTANAELAAEGTLRLPYGDAGHAD